MGPIMSPTITPRSALVHFSLVTARAVRRLSCTLRTVRGMFGDRNLIGWVDVSGWCRGKRGKAFYFTLSLCGSFFVYCRPGVLAVFTWLCTLWVRCVCRAGKFWVGCEGLLRKWGEVRRSAGWWARRLQLTLQHTQYNGHCQLHKDTIWGCPREMLPRRFRSASKGEEFDHDKDRPET